MLVAVVVHVHDGVAFGRDGDTLVITGIVGALCRAQMEAGILVVCAVNTGISAVALAVDANGIDRAVDSTGAGDRRSKVISVACNVLLPDQNGIAGSRVRRPLGIDGRVVGDRVAEYKRGGARFVGIPTAEGIAVPYHRTVFAGLRGHLIGIDEIRRVVGGSLAVLVKHQPVAFRCVHAELDAAGDGDRSAVIVERSLAVVFARIPSIDIAAARIDFPAFEIVLVVLDGIGHINGVALRSLSGVGAERHLLLAKADPMLIIIRDGIALEEHGVIIDFIAVGNASIELCLNGLTHILNGEGRCFRGVILDGSPTAEVYAVRDRSDAGIVQDEIKVAGVCISLRNLDGYR